MKLTHHIRLTMLIQKLPDPTEHVFNTLETNITLYASKASEILGLTALLEQFSKSVNRIITCVDKGSLISKDSTYSLAGRLSLPYTTKIGKGSMYLHSNHTAINCTHFPLSIITPRS